MKKRKEKEKKKYAYIHTEFTLDIYSQYVYIMYTEDRSDCDC